VPRRMRRLGMACKLLSVSVLALSLAGMFEMTLGCLKWAAVGFIVAFALMKLYEASHIHDDIPKPEFKIQQSKRAALVLSVFAAMLSALVWLLVQNWG
jgi:phosphate/sulfate permease